MSFGLDYNGSEGDDAVQWEGDEGGEQPCRDAGAGERPYEEFAETMEHFTRFSGWQEISSLNYGDQSDTCRIVTSIEFDRAPLPASVGGVTKKIKVTSSIKLI